MVSFNSLGTAAMFAQTARWLLAGRRPAGSSGIVTALVLVAVAGTLLGAEADDVAERLARAPRPWEASMYRFSLEEYRATLAYWAEKHPGLVTLQTPAETPEKMPIALLRITDGAVPDEDKQVCLVTSLHTGPERSGGTTVLHLAQWLLGDTPEAAEIRRRQIVLLMPIGNPYAFFVTDRWGNSQGVDPYTAAQGKLWDLRSLQLTEPDKSPELAALLAVVDRYQPEVHADVHGIGLQEYAADRLGDRRLYQGQTMFESSGSAYSNFALRPWDWRVIEALAAAAREAGYGSDRFEADAQRSLGGPGLEAIGDRLWSGRAMFYPAHYAYAKYHTMMLTMEIGWEESGVARLRGLLRLGNQVWEGEPVAGYPVDRVKALCGHFVVASGRTAAARRRSRVELWQRQAAFGQAMLYPQTDCRDSYVVAFTARGKQLLDPDKTRFLANLKDQPGFRHDALEAFFRMGPEDKLYVEAGGPAEAAAPLQHGLALRLRIPYRKPEIIDLRLNGQRLDPDTDGGYHSWYADGYTQVQIELTPPRMRDLDLAVVTCAYRPDVSRTTGWQPPPEVLERLRAKPTGAGR